jgi:hypothetical protein
VDLTDFKNITFLFAKALKIVAERQIAHKFVGNIAPLDTRRQRSYDGRHRILQTQTIIGTINIFATPIEIQDWFGAAAYDVAHERQV